MSKALLLTAPGTIEIQAIEKPTLKPGQALIQVKAAALNRRDQWIREGKYPNIQYPTVLGSDAAGIVESVYEGATAEEQAWVGRAVVINPNINWGDDPAVQSSAYEILGMPANGTLRSYIAIDLDRLQASPSHLDFDLAAALPLAGLTAYRAIFHHGRVGKGDKVLISGFGGGVAQFAFQFALALGAEVYVSSGSEEKIKKAEVMGAAKGFDYKVPAWQKEAKKLSGGFDVVIDSAGGQQLADFVKIMRPAGRIVFYGATNGLPENIVLFRRF